MTLKLALHGLLADRVAEPGAGDATPQDLKQEQAGPLPEPPVDRDPLEELAMAMGTVVERAGAASTASEPAVDEDPVVELAMAMGAVAGREADQVPTELETGEPPAPADLLAGLETGEPLVDGPVAGVSEARETPAPILALAEPAAAEPGDSEAGEDRAAVSERLDDTVVAVVGLRAAGLHAVIALRAAGAKVIAIDPSPSRLRDIRSGRAELSRSRREQVRGLVAGDGLVLTEQLDTLASADAVLICVATPTGRDRRPDNEPLRRACAEVVDHARAGQTVVLLHHVCGEHAGDAGAATAGARAARRGGRVRRVQPRAVGPRRLRAGDAGNPAGAGSRHRALLGALLAAAAADMRRAAPRLLAAGRGDEQAV